MKNYLSQSFVVFAFGIGLSVSLTGCEAYGVMLGITSVNSAVMKRATEIERPVGEKVDSSAQAGGVRMVSNGPEGLCFEVKAATDANTFGAAAFTLTSYRSADDKSKLLAVTSMRPEVLSHEEHQEWVPGKTEGGPYDRRYVPGKSITNHDVRARVCFPDSQKVVGPEANYLLFEMNAVPVAAFRFKPAQKS